MTEELLPCFSFSCVFFKSCLLFVLWFSFSPSEKTLHWNSFLTKPSSLLQTAALPRVCVFRGNLQQRKLKFCRSSLWHPNSLPSTSSSPSSRVGSERAVSPEPDWGGPRLGFLSNCWGIKNYQVTKTDPDAGTSTKTDLFYNPAFCNITSDTRFIIYLCCIINVHINNGGFLFKKSLISSSNSSLVPV